MRRLLRAIRNVLRAMRRAAARWKEVLVEVGAKLVRRRVPSGVPVEPDEPEVSETAELAPDQFGNDVRELARQLIADGNPDPDRLAALPADVARWLTVLDDAQLRTVMRASDDALQAHLRGRKGLVGVPGADKESVDEWVAAQTGRDIDDPEIEYQLAWRPA